MLACPKMMRFICDRQLQVPERSDILTRKRIRADDIVPEPSNIGKKCSPTTFHFRESSTLNPFPERPVDYKLIFLKKRSRVQEIVSVGDSLLISLQHSGVCCVFKRDEASNGFKQHGYLNHRPEEIVRSLFYNRSADAIVVVSVYPAERKSVLRCRSIAVSDVILGNFERSFPILENEILGYPGWIELCEVNAKILTFSAETQTYKVWDLKTNYAFQYTIKSAPGEKLWDVKASPGFLLLIYEPTTHGVDQRFQRIALVDIQDGSELYALNYPLRTRIELVEQFCDSILIKEQDHDLVVHFVRRPFEKPKEVAMGSHRLNAFTFLHSSRVFLTFQGGGRVCSFDSQGNEICKIYKDDPTSGDDSNSIVLVARDQETLLSVRKDIEVLQHSLVEFRHVVSGKLLARVPLEFPASEVSCACYDEDKMALFIGTREGLIYSWEV